MTGLRSDVAVGETTQKSDDKLDDSLPTSSSNRFRFGPYYGPYGRRFGYYGPRSYNLYGPYGRFGPAPYGYKYFYGYDDSD